MVLGAGVGLGCRGLFKMFCVLMEFVMFVVFISDPFSQSTYWISQKFCSKKLTEKPKGTFWPTQ